MNKFALTFDIEPDYGGRVNTYNGLKEGLPIILDLLREHKVKGTFFVTADVVKEFPKTIKALSEFHEVGCHGLKHTPIQTREEIIHARQIFTKYKLYPKGFRNPYLTPRKDIIPDLFSEGFKYDSSLVRSAFPFRYNHLTMPREPYYPSRKNIHKKSNRHLVKEIPVSTVPGTIIPFGMTFIRNKAYSVYHHLISKSKNDLVFYAHGHDFIAPDKNVPFYARSGKDIALKRLTELLSLDFEFVTMEELL